MSDGYDGDVQRLWRKNGKANRVLVVEGVGSASSGIFILLLWWGRAGKHLKNLHISAWLTFIFALMKEKVKKKVRTYFGR